MSELRRYGILPLVEQRMIVRLRYVNEPRLVSYAVLSQRHGGGHETWPDGAYEKIARILGELNAHFGAEILQ